MEKVFRKEIIQKATGGKSSGPITAEAFDCQDIFQWFDSASKKIEKSTDDGEQLSLF